MEARQDIGFGGGDVGLRGRFLQRSQQHRRWLNHRHQPTVCSLAAVRSQDCPSPTERMDCYGGRLSAVVTGPSASNQSQPADKRIARCLLSFLGRIPLFWNASRNIGYLSHPAVFSVYKSKQVESRRERNGQED
jgi:hypothetical protein